MIRPAVTEIDRDGDARPVGGNRGDGATETEDRRGGSFV